MADVDGVAAAGLSPIAVAHYLGIAPTYVDATTVGGCSFLLHVRHAAAAIAAGHCEVVLITHGESGRSRVGMPPRVADPTSPQGQFEAPFGTARATDHVPDGRTALHEGDRPHATSNWPRSPSRSEGGPPTCRARCSARRSPSRTCWRHDSSPIRCTCSSAVSSPTAAARWS